MAFNGRGRIDSTKCILFKSNGWIVNDAICCDHRITIFSICYLTALLHTICTFLIFYYSFHSHTQWYTQWYVIAAVRRCVSGKKKKVLFLSYLFSTHHNQMRSTKYFASRSHGFSCFWLSHSSCFACCVASLVLSIVVLCHTIVSIPTACTVCSVRSDVSLCASNNFEW